MNNLKLRYRFIDILVSDWFTLNNDFSLIGGINIFQVNFPIDENLLNLCNAYGYDKEIIKSGLKENKYNSNTAVYRILLKKIEILELNLLGIYILMNLKIILKVLLIGMKIKIVCKK